MECGRLNLPPQMSENWWPFQKIDFWNLLSQKIWGHYCHPYLWTTSRNNFRRLPSMKHRRGFSPSSLYFSFSSLPSSPSQGNLDWSGVTFWLNYRIMSFLTFCLIYDLTVNTLLFGQVVYSFLVNLPKTVLQRIQILQGASYLWHFV